MSLEGDVCKQAGFSVSFGGLGYRRAGDIAMEEGSSGASLPDDPKLPIVKKNWNNMLLEANQVCRARLMATAQKESGAWLNALPASALGTLLHSESFRVAIAP